MSAIDRLQGLVGSVAIKAPVRVATTAAITLNGTQTVDGVAVVSGDRVLVKDQADQTANGIYVADTGNWTRDADFNGTRDCVQGTIVVVVSGTISGATVYQLTTASPVIGTSSLTFAVAGAAALALASNWIRTNLLPASTQAAARSALSVPFDLVKDYGADPTGVTDIQPALVSAMAALPNGGIIWLPAGTFKLVLPVTLSTTGIIIRGAGDGTIIKPSTDAIGTMFNLTGTSTEIHDLKIDGSAIVSPTFTAIKVNASGLNRLNNLYINGAGTGISVPACNAGRFTNIRVQACVVCVQTGGINGSFPGDDTWTEIVAIPTTAGTGWIIDGNSNAQYLQRVEIIGGANCMLIRGSGATTSRPDGIFLSECNLTASSGNVLIITKGTDIRLDNTVIGGSTAGHGVQINAVANADVEGVEFENCLIRANFQRGISWESGANVRMSGGSIYGNSDGGGSGVYSNIYVGASAVGLFYCVGVMAGLGSVGNIYANIVAPTKYGIEIAAGALTDAVNFPGRVLIEGNMLLGNTTGTILDASAPTGAAKYIAQAVNPGFCQFVASAVNFNSANTDNAIAIVLPFGFTRYQVSAARISGASQTLTTATCGLFTAAAAGGVAIVTSATAITVASASDATNNNSQSLTVNNAGTESYTAASLYFRVQTAQGAAATGTVTITVVPLP